MAVVDTTAFANLSPREAQVLSMASEGRLDKEISAELGLSLNTLRTYWNRIRGKVGELPRIALATAYVEQRKEEPVRPVLADESADWEVDLVTGAIIYHTPDPNAPEIPTGHARPLSDVFESFHPDDVPALRSALQGVIDGSLNTFTYTARRITSRGLVVVSAFVQVIRDPVGRPMKLYGKRTTPIDARPSPGDGNFAVGLWSRDLRSGEIWVDEGFRSIYGISGDEPDMRQAILERNHPDDRHIAANYVDEMIRHGHTHMRRTFRIRDTDGTYRWASADVYMETDEGGPTRTRGTVIVYPRS